MQDDHTPPPTAVQTSRTVIARKRTRAVGAHHKQTYATPRQSREYLEAIGREAVAQIKPDAIVAYADKIVIWQRDVWNVSDMKKFTRRHGVDVQDDEPKRPLFVDGRRFPQRLRLIRPTREAMQELVEDEPRLKQVEFAYDLFFNTKAAWWYADDTFERYSVKRYSARQPLRHFSKGRPDTTRYFGHKDVNAITFVKYSDPDRARTKLETAYPYWLHMEWIITGTPALTRVILPGRRSDKNRSDKDRSDKDRSGSASVVDLWKLDRREFVSKRLLLADIDRGALGRALSSYRAPGRRAWCPDPVADGDSLFRAAQITLPPEKEHLKSSQAVVARFPFLPVVAECLIPLPVDHLLPSSGSFLRSVSLY